MIINHRYRFIFLHVPKTAGTSITNYLSTFTGWNDIELGGTHYGEQIQEIYGRRFKLNKHSTARQVRTIIGEDLWRGYFKFAVVRHPLDRLVSAYQFYRQWEHPSTDAVRAFAGFEEFVQSDFFAADRRNATRPTGSQTAFLSDTGLAVDQVCRFESLADDLATVASRLGLGNLPAELPQLNASERTHWEDYYSPATLEIAMAVYQDDFATFGYPLPHLASQRRQLDREGYEVS